MYSQLVSRTNQLLYFLPDKTHQLVSITNHFKEKQLVSIAHELLFYPYNSLDKVLLLIIDNEFDSKYNKSIFM